MSLRSVTISGAGRIARPSTPSTRGGERISTINTNQNVSGPKRPVFTWKQELVSESTDGLTKVYELSKKPSYNLTVTVYINGVLQRQNIDYTVDGKVITFTEVVSAGSNIIVKYNAVSIG